MTDRLRAPAQPLRLERPRTHAASNPQPASATTSPIPLAPMNRTSRSSGRRRRHTSSTATTARSSNTNPALAAGTPRSAASRPAHAANDTAGTTGTSRASLRVGGKRERAPGHDERADKPLTGA
jgi:hypothetical protein